MKKKKKSSVNRDTTTARFLVQQRERDESPWREKINLMVNEFLPSASGQLRRRVEEGPENGGMTGMKAPKVNRKKVGRDTRDPRGGRKGGCIVLHDIQLLYR